MKSRIILLSLVCSGFASAVTIVQVQPFSFIPGNTIPLVFNEFNPAWGTLNSITITTNVTKSGGALYVDNEAGSPASGNISQSVTITLDSLDVTLLADPTGLIGSNVTATSVYAASTTADNGDTPGVVDVDTPGHDYDGTAFGPVSTFETKNVRPLVLSDYMGTGTFTINAIGSQGFNTSAFGGASVAIAPATVSGNVTITYDYVPEPGAALLGGLGMLALLRRRR